jgi:hypothetical protein
MLCTATSLHAVTTGVLCAQANFAWAYATLGVMPSRECMDALCGHAEATLMTFAPQNISNTAWALATLHHARPVCLPSQSI